MMPGSSSRVAPRLCVANADAGSRRDGLAFAVNLAVRYHMFQYESGKPTKEME